MKNMKFNKTPLDSFKLLILLLLLSLGCKEIESTPKKDIKVEADSWDALSNYVTDPEWFANSKLGIYFHWGPYSVPAFHNEWYPRWMYVKGTKAYNYHTENYGDPSKFGYHDFIPMFKAEKFNAKDWALLFKSSGAQFAGPIAQHHDGFAMWDSEVNPWNASDMGPKRDVVGEITSEVKKLGLKTITTFHHARTFQRFKNDSTKWGDNASYFPYNPIYGTSSEGEKLRYLYGNMPWDEFQEYWLEEIREVVDNYQPDIIWFDSGLDRISEEYRKKMVALQIANGLKNEKETIVAYKQEDLPSNIGVLDIEQGGMRDISPDYWLTDMTISNNSWSYVKGQTYKKPELLIRNMIDIWSKRGIVLLNVSPTAEGVINQEQQHVLNAIGKWINKHEEAVYQTKPYKIFGYGEALVEDGRHGGQKANTEYSHNDIRFTISKDSSAIYIYVLGKPKPKETISIKHISEDYKDRIKAISLLGSHVPIEWNLNNALLNITTPNSNEMDNIATVFKVSLK